jgi:2-iminobutanoate/2-iminopropanoate deaminase
MSIQRVFPVNAPTPRGPYSPAVRAGDFIYVSGQGPIDPITDKVVPGGIQDQTRQTLINIRTILGECGATLADVVRCGVFLRDGSEFAAMNEVYAEFFGTAKPARTTIACEFHAKDMRVEIDCVAYKPKA